MLMSHHFLPSISGQAVYWFVIALARQSSWAYVLLSCTVSDTNIHSNSLLKSISRNVIWSAPAKFLYPAIFVVRYPVFENIVKNRFGFFSLNQLIIFLCLCYVATSSSTKDRSESHQARTKRSPSNTSSS
jgi:hypothetical protein